MAGLERPDTGSVTVAGEELDALGEDALARFRGRNVGIVFQSFHLIPTMTALENVAVPLELAGAPMPTSAPRTELAAVGLGDRLSALSGAIVRRRAAARGARARAGSQSCDPGRRRADRQSRRDDRRRRSSTCCSRSRRARHHAGAGDARPRAGARAATAWCGCAPAASRPTAGADAAANAESAAMSAPRRRATLRCRCASPCANCAAACAAFTSSSPASRSA